MYPHPFNPAPSISRNHMSSPAHSFETFDVGRSLTTVLGVTRDVGNKIFRVSSKMGRKSHSASVKEVSVLWIKFLEWQLAHPRHVPSLDRKSSSIRVCLLDCVIECDPVSACLFHEHGQNNTNYDIKVISVIPPTFRTLLKSSSLCYESCVARGCCLWMSIRLLDKGCIVQFEYLLENHQGADL